MSDPADLSPPKDPADYRPPRLLGVSFWAMMVFGLVCIAAGVAVALVVPRLLGAKAAPPALAATEQPAATPTATAPMAPPAAVLTPVSEAPADVARLDARMAALETRERDAAQASAAALAAAALVESSQGSRPFPAELAAVRAASPPSPELASLTRLADVGAPSRAALASSFPDYAAHAAAASRAPGQGAGLGARIAYTLSKIVTVRRVGDVEGDSADAQLARAERLVEDGDLDQALSALDRLPPGARDAMAPWRARAERRAEIDRTVGLLRARALQDLAAASRAGA